MGMFTMLDSHLHSGFTDSVTFSTAVIKASVGFGVSSFRVDIDEFLIIELLQLTGE